MNQQRSFIGSLIKYIAEFKAGNPLFTPFPVEVVSGSSGGGGSTSSATISSGIDNSADVETIKSNGTQGNITLDSINTKSTNILDSLEDIQTTLGGLEQEAISLAATGSFPTVGNDLIFTLPTAGLFNILISSNVNGAWQLLSSGEILNLYTENAEFVVGNNSVRSYFFYANSTTVTLRNFNASLGTAISFTCYRVKYPPTTTPQRVLEIFLNGNQTSEFLSCAGYKEVSVNSNNCFIEEVTSGSTIPNIFRVGNVFKLNTQFFRVTNTSSTAQSFTLILSTTSTGVETSSLLSQTLGVTGSTVQKSLVVGGSKAGAIQPLNLDVSNKLLVSDTELAINTSNTNTLLTTLDNSVRGVFSKDFKLFSSVASATLIDSPLSVDGFVLESVYFRNNSGAVVFLQIIVASALPVTGAVPSLSIRVAGNTALILGADFFTARGLKLSSSLGSNVYFAQSSTEATYTPTTSSITTHLLYKLV
jgi:hypothetical protein